MSADEQRTKMHAEAGQLQKFAWEEEQPKKKFELVQKINELKKKRGYLDGKEKYLSIGKREL